MEGFLFPPYKTRYPPPSGGSWEKREGRFVVPHGFNYLELCKAILSQVSPALPPPHRASTRDCGVQVNAKVDKIVQCSLGPKTLFFDDHLAPSKTPPRSPDGRERCATPPLSGLRFRRPVSIYSPVFDRRLCLKLGDDSGSEEEEEEEEEEAAEEQEAEEGAEAEAEGEQGGEEAVEEPKTSAQRPPKSANFQFLEQRYGFFHCKKCNIRWESAYVWCISGTNKVRVGSPARGVHSLQGKGNGCSQTSCDCDKKQRHINMNRPHRQDLCCRCRGMRLSCDATYSFKYIV
uniref:Zygote arrest 1-like n=1 Tax=Salarias fasciatus TaxID=181472 RepID=A0A672FFM4_SALFA